MREVVVTGTQNRGCVIQVEQDYLYKGTNFYRFEEQLKNNSGTYCGYNHNTFGPSTSVAINIDGVVSYCSSDRPLLLAIRHEPYEIDTSRDEEGFVLKGLIRLEDIVQVTTEQILLKVCPDFHNLSEGAQKRVKFKAGIPE